MGLALPAYSSYQRGTARDTLWVTGVNISRRIWESSEFDTKIESKKNAAQLVAEALHIVDHMRTVILISQDDACNYHVTAKELGSNCTIVSNSDNVSTRDKHIFLFGYALD